MKIWSPSIIIPRPRVNAYRRHLNIPGMLAKAVEQRMEELESGTFSRFAVELVCFDLRIRRNHSLTHPLSLESGGMQEVIDREIVQGYRPGEKQSGDAIRALVRDAVADGGSVRRKDATLAKVKELVYFPALHHEAIETRWRELGCRGVSDYLTSLIRYDLLLGGPHKYFHGDDCSPEMLAALDRETLQLFHENAQPEIFADRLMQQEVGRPITREESERLMRIAAEQLRKRALAR